MEITLSIIIPCKNEEKYIGKLLTSLVEQKLPKYVEIIVADNASTDNTISIIKKYLNLLPNLRIIKGGLPSVGRNLGALEARGDILLFLDSDVYFKDTSLIMDSLRIFREKNVDILGCLLNIEDDLVIKAIYGLCNVIFHLSKLDKPFVVGSYMMIDKRVFFSIGGFDETLMHCEDYFLSKEINKDKYYILNRYHYTDDRRFKKLGTINMVKYFTSSLLQKNNKEHFKKDIGYWL